MPKVAERDFMYRDDLLPNPIDLVRGLYAETYGRLQRTDELHAWYNRGYANGVLELLQEREPDADLSAIGELDPVDPIAGHERLPCGRAYKHGLEKGRGEALQVWGRGPGA